MMAGLHNQTSDARRVELERVLVGIFCEVLDREGVGVHDGFFDLGGRSVQVDAIRHRVAEALGLHVPAVVFFEHPTIRELALHLAGAEPAPASPDETDLFRGARLARRRAELRGRRAGPA